MAWLELPADDATPQLARIASTWTRHGQAMPEVVGIMKLAPNTLKTVLRANHAITFGGSSLGRRREELIATTVSALNECFY